MKIGRYTITFANSNVFITYGPFPEKSYTLDLLTGKTSSPENSITENLRKDIMNAIYEQYPEDLI